MRRRSRSPTARCSCAPMTTSWWPHASCSPVHASSRRPERWCCATTSRAATSWRSATCPQGRPCTSTGNRSAWPRSTSSRGTTSMCTTSGWTAQSARTSSAPGGRRCLLRPERTFLGYHRANGRVGTRNFVGVLTSVNCSASPAKMIADQFRGAALDAFPNVDGVIALTHQSGCGLVPGSEGANTLLRTLRGYARHPNFGGVLVLGLGCEMVPVQSLVDGLDLPSDTLVQTLTIQDTGGVRATVRAGVERIREMLPVLEARRRAPAPILSLVLGLNCGGSDGYSGITANPALGYASDRIVAAGGTSILGETPEVFGAEHLLTRRAVSESVGRKLLDRIDWWQGYAQAGGGTLDNNPSPGNKAGGLTTILEKSLGAVAKAGQADLAAVYEYAEPVTERGLVFMDTGS